VGGWYTTTLGRAPGGLMALALRMKDKALQQEDLIGYSFHLHVSRTPATTSPIPARSNTAVMGDDPYGVT
jgi:hypothetical protein